MIIMLQLMLLFMLSSSCFGMYEKNSDVVELTPSNFNKLVVNGDEVWIVEFYAPWCGHCQSFAPEFSKAATALKGVVKVGAVNADDHKDLGGRFGVKGFPTVKIFGANKNKPEDYNGARTADGLIDAALNAVEKKVRGRGRTSGSHQEKESKSDDVIELTDANFDKKVLESEDMWLVEFFAPWCGHCKNLAPHWAKAATELKGKVKLGALDATVHQTKAAQYGVQGYPTIKFFPPGKKTSSSAADYDGGRTANDIVNWALDKLAENVPAPDIVEVTNPSVFKEHCEDKPLCVVSVLPDILDCQSKCRNAYLDILKDLGEKYKKKMWGWIWTPAGHQVDLETALDIGGFGYPAMAVINPKKMKFSILRGAFSKDGINEFLRDLSYGRGNTAPVRGQELPKIYSYEAWDGLDGEYPVDESIDEYDMDYDRKDEL